MSAGQFGEGSNGTPVQPVPQQRIREKLDEYMSRRDYAGAERLLLYWLREAHVGGDQRGELMVENELIGHYRKTGNREGALEAIEGALNLLALLEFGDTISAGTTYVNAATALNAFGENERALSLFEQARAIYEDNAAESRLLGGLYNNMALTCASLGRFEDAVTLYDKAMVQMGRASCGELEQAITCLNRANLIEARDGMEAGEKAIFDLLDQASDLLRGSCFPRDGYYAFVCEKCAPTFEYYGYFAEAEHLRQEASDIYERS